MEIFVYLTQYLNLISDKSNVGVSLLIILPNSLNLLPKLCQIWLYLLIYYFILTYRTIYLFMQSRNHYFATHFYLEYNYNRENKILYIIIIYFILYISYFITKIVEVIVRRTTSYAAMPLRCLNWFLTWLTFSQGLAQIRQSDLLHQWSLVRVSLMA